MNFSETEQLAVDTFVELQDQVKAFGLHNFEREDRLLFKQGRELLEQAKNRHLRKDPIHRYGSRVPLKCVLTKPCGHGESTNSFLQRVPKHQTQ